MSTFPPAADDVLTSITSDSIDETEQVRLANSIIDVRAVIHTLPLFYSAARKEAPSSSSTSPVNFQLSYCPTSALTPKQTLRMFKIYEANMKTHYEETWGWDKNARFKELFDSSSRFIIMSVAETAQATTVDAATATSPEAAAAPPLPSPHPHAIANTNDITGFCAYRFSWDDDDEPEHAVLYIYELQVAASHQGLGIGCVLTEAAVHIGQTLRMWKILLTCFKRNEQAMRFYLQNGFAVDSNSPSAFGNTGEDYEILSFSRRGT